MKMTFEKNALKEVYYRNENSDRKANFKRELNDNYITRTNNVKIFERSYL